MSGNLGEVNKTRKTIEHGLHDVHKRTIEKVGVVEPILGIIVPIGALETNTEDGTLQNERNNAEYARWKSVE